MDAAHREKSVRPPVSTKRISASFSRRLPSLRQRPTTFSPRIFLLVLAAAALAAATVRADETTRRVQEELRKRNLYYGDINGQRSRATVGALRRYQERKGFQATGDLDEMTLRSLSIEPSLVAAGGDDAEQPPAPDESASRGTGSWPTGTVLKSDRAPRPRTNSSGGEGDGEKDLISTAIANVSGTRGHNSVGNSGGNSGGNSPASAAKDAPAIPPQPQKSDSSSASSRPPVGKPLTLDEARQFIEDYLRAGETNGLEEELKFYADQVNYFNQGTVGRAYIRRDVQRYYRRWPERHFELIEPFVIAPGPHEDESTVRFAVRFRYAGAGRRGQRVKVEGKTDNIFILQGSPPGDLRIVAMREQRLRN